MFAACPAFVYVCVSEAETHESGLKVRLFGSCVGAPNRDTIAHR
ncbi:hypothetical protein C7S14_1416 [Burkholderia cepacia]|nr:hypothetical protein C7S14_1416 [Burkholderia cepacia]